MKEFEQKFESVLSLVAKAEPVHKVLKDLRISEDFIAWCLNDPQRKEMYEQAQAIGTEVLAYQMLEMSANPPDPEQLAFYKVKTDVLKFLMKSWNAKRYGDKQQLEVTNQIDISDAMAAAQARLTKGITIEGD